MATFDALVTEPDDFLVLPIPGRDGVVRNYTIPPVPAEFWYRVSAIGEVVVLALNGIQPNPALIDEVKGLSKDEQYKLVLSAEVVDAMIADGISGVHLQRAFTTGVMFHTSGGDVERAKVAWSGKVLGPNRAQRRSSKTSARQR